MKTRNMSIPLAVVAGVVALAVIVTVLASAFAGISAAKKTSSPQGAVVSGALPPGVAGTTTNSSDSSAPRAANVANESAIAQPAPSTFIPGGPPFQVGVSGDGISAWGVAYRETTDANAQPDAALVKAAYQDAEKKAADLASATGNRAGKLLAMTDYSLNQPYFRGCIQPATGTPVPAPKTTSGSGGTGAGTAVPAIAPCEVQSNHYVVVWVFVRHALG